MGRGNPPKAMKTHVPCGAGLLVCRWLSAGVPAVRRLGRVFERASRQLLPAGRLAAAFSAFAPVGLRAPRNAMLELDGNSVERRGSGQVVWGAGPV